ncbi:high mobility group protein DSP1-like [Agrilus planipennis]|uniref:High mobility group protein DSP1-like n=1 Tax=Agrilus planipennis TaxID=224129 RepID=A0A7F5RHE3_AGRPL|nr:high mobility group protein DSP1-like [Agrilus planipennis]
MSDLRGSWDTQNNAMWWPGTLTDQQSLQQHQQQLLHQHQLQQQAVAQQVAVTQQQDASINSAEVAAQQLFPYKMTSSFHHPATSLANVSATNLSIPSVSSPTNSDRSYDYRLSGGASSLGISAPTHQWWGYANTMDNSVQSSGTSGSAANNQGANSPSEVSTIEKKSLGSVIYYTYIFNCPFGSQT